METESDVEQKFVMNLLTSKYPNGLGINEKNIKTKTNITEVKIGKGTDRKLYFPDYLVVVDSVPVMVVEVKKPGEDVDEGFREARLYASEINAQFKPDRNPIRWVISTNWEESLFGRYDHERPEQRIPKDAHHAGSNSFSAMVDSVNRSELAEYAKKYKASRKSEEYWKAKRLVGGSTIQNQEIGQNDFGSQLSLDYRHLFNPRSKEERAHVVKNAYITSERRRRYVDSIDRVLRAAKPPSVEDPTTIKTTEKPREIIETLRDGTELEGEIILLVGRVGSGKSTFVDYLREVALPKDIKDSTLWTEVDLNDAQVNPESIYTWVSKSVIEKLKDRADRDFDKYENLRTLFHPQLKEFIDGPLEALGEDHPDYKREIYDKLKSLMGDHEATLDALFRHLGSERARLPVVVLDNADRGIRDEQLLMFQVAKWLQSNFRCLVFLPIREQTYDNYRDEPPLDTAIKDLLFRIESPPFQKVLSRRISLAVKEIKEEKPNERLKYSTSSGATVTYKRKDQADFLESLKKSLFDHNNFLRNIIVGLAGRNIRRAMEIFLEFCRSGYIDNDTITKIKLSQGKYTLPYKKVANVAFRMNKKYYSDSSAYIKNVFKLVQSDDEPSHFIRLAILRWLKSREDVQGPRRIEGFHQVSTLVSDFEDLGFSRSVVQRELLDLLKANCIVAEHLRTDRINPEDLVHIAPAGDVHLRVMNNIQYLSAVSEDTWIDMQSVAQDIAERIGSNEYHHKERNEVLNAQSFGNYLKERQQETLKRLNIAKEKNKISLINVTDILEECQNKVNESIKEDPWYLVIRDLSKGDIIEGTIADVHPQYGLFVTVFESESGEAADGLLHVSNITGDHMQEYHPGDTIKVKVDEIKAHEERLSLKLAK